MTATVAPAAPSARTGSWLPTRAMVSTKCVELRKRKGLMWTMAVLVVAIPVIVYAIRFIDHAADPSRTGPAGSPAVFSFLTDLLASFGFIAAATLGASAGTTDLSDGVFRHLVITGRSRVALYLARIPAGLAIIVPIVGATFAVLCLVTSFAGSPTPSAVTVQSLNGTTVVVPPWLSESQFATWAEQNSLSPSSFTGGGPNGAAPRVDQLYTVYVANEVRELTPPANEYVKIGLWAETVVVVGFLVGLGLGSLIGQRTVSTILLIVLQIVLTPIATMAQIPDFINGQRLIVGVALAQLRPTFLRSGGGEINGAPKFGGRGALDYGPMPTWAMVAVIVVWIVGWTVIGARRSATRDT